MPKQVQILEYGLPERRPLPKSYVLIGLSIVVIGLVGYGMWPRVTLAMHNYRVRNGLKECQSYFAPPGTIVMETDPPAAAALLSRPEYKAAQRVGRPGTVAMRRAQCLQPLDRLLAGYWQKGTQAMYLTIPPDVPWATAFVGVMQDKRGRERTVAMECRWSSDGDRLLFQSRVLDPDLSRSPDQSAGVGPLDVGVSFPMLNGARSIQIYWGQLSSDRSRLRLRIVRDGMVNEPTFILSDRGELVIEEFGGLNWGIE